MAEHRIIFAGGGTGGTVGPGVAIAERLLDLDASVQIHFLCSDRVVDRTMLAPGPWTFTPMPAAVPSVRPGAGLRFATGWWRTRRAAGRLIGLGEGTRVVSLGGFVAPPVVAAATAARVPVDLLNLDAVAGRANRWVARRATRILTSVPTDLPGAGNALGIPLRRAVLPIDSRAEACEILGLDPTLRTLLVTGASQGARSIDRFMQSFIDADAAAMRGWQVLHLASPATNDALVESYTAAGIPHVVLPFLDRMGLAWTVADLVISRGGASSVAEIAGSRTPAIILPYPWHRDRHQARNAEAIVESGLAEVLDDPSDGPSAAAALADHLRSALADPKGLDRRRTASMIPTEDAARIIARLILHPDPEDSRTSLPNG